MVDGELEGLARRLRMARAALGITQAEAADMASVSQSALSLYEKGRRDPPVTSLKRLAVAYGVTLDWLMGITDAMRQRSRTFTSGPDDGANER